MLRTDNPLAWAPWELEQLTLWAWGWQGCSSRAGHPPALANAFQQLGHRRVLAAAVQACSSGLAAPPQLLNLLRMCPSALIT